MKWDIDLSMAGKMILIIFVGIVAGYVFFSLGSFSQKNTEKQETYVKEIIDKALVQCYALEGSYPTDLEYLTGYGVIIDHDRYFYEFQDIGENIKPIVIVVSK